MFDATPETQNLCQLRRNGSQKRFSFYSIGYVSAATSEPEHRRVADPANRTIALVDPHPTSSGGMWLRNCGRPMRETIPAMIARCEKDRFVLPPSIVKGLRSLIT